MPLYSYVCDHCKGKLEVLRAITEHDTPPTPEEVTGAGLSVCSDAAGHKLERHIGPTSFKLQGWGWFNKGGY